MGTRFYGLMVSIPGMTKESDRREARAISPEEAFAVLGEKTRLEILRALGDAGGPLAFSELFERVEYETTANFSYHLDKLVGHFVHESEDGYELRQSGRRVVEAILSGAVTEAPVLDPTEIDRQCQHCGADSVTVEYVEEQVGVYCTQCRGQYGGDADTDGSDLPANRERIGYAYLPPAGLRSRTPAGALDAAATWSALQAQSLHRGVCPRCSAAVEDTVQACESHSLTDDICTHCDRRFAVVSHSQCTNCPFELSGAAIGHLHARTEVLAFLLNHGVDPFAPDADGTLEAASFAEEVVETEPLLARFTFTIDGDELAVTVDEDFAVLDAVERRSAEPPS